MHPTDAEIADMKALWIDKTVHVKTLRPELKRFEGRIGRVKEVNFNGRCLVEFQGIDDIGWYDIHPDFLVVETGPAAD